MKPEKALRLSLTYICLICTFLMYSQNRMIEEGNKEYDRFAFINSREYYLELAQKESASQELLEKLGNSYYFTADYANAAKWYKRLLTKTKETKPEYVYRYALSVKSTGDYNKSDSIMNVFYSLKGNDFRAQLFNKQRDYLKEIEMQSDRFDVKKTNFNSPSSDFAPIFYGDTVVFSSNRDKASLEKNIHLWNNQDFLDLYKVYNLNDNPVIKKFDKDINTKFHESTAVFTKDYQTIYFTRNNYYDKVYKENSEGVNLLKLFRADRVNGKWIIKELPFNSDEYSVAHPALSNDGKTLYFSSDMPGGFGQGDLYKIEIKENGYGTPVNLGKTINTEGRETFPFISKDNKMYFASDGHVGLGGLDVFISEMNTDGTLGEPFNLGNHVNSKNDDFTFIINSDSQKGYFASNRDNDAYDDDIYEVVQKEKVISKCVQYVNGVIKDSEGGQILANAKVSLYDNANNLIATTVSGPDGSFKFDNELPCSKIFSLRVEKSNYSPKEVVVTATTEPEGRITQEITMEKENLMKNTDLARIIKLEPIKFEFDKSRIVKESEKELNKVIEAMELYPDIKIDVRSHTDNRGSADYNRSLSERRAQATIKYLVEKGKIDPSRISGRGYGEDQPVYDCDKMPCSEEQYHTNRRSEFIII